MSTIQDVAKAAKVSVATVSRVLNNSTLVLPDTKQAVLEAISILNYQPNLLGRNLRRTETRMIGTSHWIFSDYHDGARGAGGDSGPINLDPQPQADCKTRMPSTLDVAAGG